MSWRRWKSEASKTLDFQNEVESLKMSENESIVEYFLKVEEVVNMIRGLGDEVKEELIIQKVLRSLPSTDSINC